MFELIITEEVNELLKELATSLDAINLRECNLANNIYNYENIVYMLNYWNTQKIAENIKIENTSDKFKKLILDINRYEHLEKSGKATVYSEIVAYSAGMYGNNGRIDKIVLYNKNSTSIYYIYY